MMRKMAACLVVGPVLSVGVAASALAAETAFGSREDMQNLIAGICTSQLPIGDKACSCLAERSMTELDDPQREYLILTAVQPPAAERNAMAHSQPDLLAIATFIDTAAKECSAANPPAAAPPAEAAPDAPAPEAPALEAQ